MNRHWRWWLASSLLGIAALAGCNRNGSGSSQSPERVRIGYFANVTHAQGVLGIASGDFAKALSPAKVEPRVFKAGPALIEALFAGEIDIGYVGPGPALNAYAQSHGEGIRIIAGAAANGVLIVARKDSGIKTLADLKGKKIAIPQLGNTQDISAKHFISSMFGADAARNVVPVVNIEQLGAMQRGDIDAAWSPEPWGSRLVVEAGGIPIAQEKELWPDKEFTLTVIVTTPEFLKAHPDVVEKVLRVHRDWTGRLTKDPSAHEKQLGDALAAANGGARLPAKVLSMSLERVKFTDDPLNSTLLAMSRWTQELGFTHDDVQLDKLVDLTILNTLRGK